MTKEHILAEIRRTTAANGGVPLGWRKFRSETGIKEADWLLVLVRKRGNLDSGPDQAAAAGMTEFGGWRSFRTRACFG